MRIADHLAVLQIAVPILSAPLCILLRQRHVVHLFALAVTFATAAVSIAMYVQVMETGPFVYEIGGWAPPLGIVYAVDALNALVLVLVSGIAALVLLYAWPSIAVEIPRDRHTFFHVMYLLFMTGLLGITVTGDMFNVYVFLEIAALSGYVLIGLGRDRRALTSAFAYLVMGTIGATFILIGIGFLYAATGTLNMADMAALLPAVEESRTVLVAFGFMTVGFAIKMALFPLHLWLPNAYTFAPSAVTAFMAASATKVTVYMLLRFFLTIYGADFTFHQEPLSLILMPLALVGMVTASVVAIFQQDVKRMLAYSSVAQIGYIVLGISFASVSGLTGGIVHMVNHGMMKCALFCAVGCIALRAGSTHIDDLRGMGRRMPVTMAAFVVAGLSIIGVPGTVGFISKWYLVKAALEAGWWQIAAVVLFSSLLAVAYIWRVVEVAYLREPPAGREGRDEAPLRMLFVLAVLVAGTVFFGLSTDLTVGMAQRAAEALLGAGG